MILCDYAACEFLATDRADGWNFCPSHYREHLTGRPASKKQASPSKRSCAVEGCPNPYCARGYCGKHYKAAVCHGDPLATAQRRPPEAVHLSLGITYRQLDHWVRAGYLKPEREQEGSGYWRHWPEEERRVGREMGQLVQAGLIPAVAHRIARDHGTRRVLAVLDPQLLEQVAS